ncbi:MAG: hypothetical protein PVJ27_05795 [Candidatus Brocadiaceae bacterium]|jgi:hypothetical protein
MGRYRDDDPLSGRGPKAAVARFLLSAFFGFLLGLLLLLTAHWFFWHGRLGTLACYLLIVLPLVCGVVGVFWFEQVTGSLRGFIETMLSWTRWRRWH